MEQIELTIAGQSPLLMHAYPMIEISGLDKMKPEDQAKHHLYSHKQGNSEIFHIPGVNFQRALVAAAAYSKGKGRASLQKVAAASLLVEEPYLDIAPQRWVVDSRPVVIPATKGRIIRHRARFDDWEVSGTITYDSALLSEKQVRQIVDDAGSRVGLLDFRPERKGPFGRFTVTKWDA
jgi:hypothetical protein